MRTPAFLFLLIAAGSFFTAGAQEKYIGKVDTVYSGIPAKKYYHIVSVNPIGYGSNSVQHGTTVGVAYEWFFSDHFSMVMPVQVNIAGTYSAAPNYEDGFNTVSCGNYHGYAVSAMPGIKFYPAGIGFAKNVVMKYSVGLSVYVGTGKEEYTKYYHQFLHGVAPPPAEYLNDKYTMWGGLVTNSISIFLKKQPHLYVGADLGLGIEYSDNNVGVDNRDRSPALLIQSALKIGYRF